MAKLPQGPKRRRTLMLVLGGGVTAIVVVFLLVYFVIFPTSSPKPFKLAATNTATSASPTTSTSSTSAAASGSSTSGSSVEGTWKRDEKIRSIGLESERFPTATFVLSSPVTVPASALSGQVAHTSVTGVFTIHGVSRRETVPLELSVSGSTVEAVGALTFPWSEFGMTAPSVGGFVNVTEHATMEFDLRLAHA